MKRDKTKNTKKAGAAVEEEHLLSFVDMCDDVILDTGASICIKWTFKMLVYPLQSCQLIVDS